MGILDQLEIEFELDAVDQFLTHFNIINDEIESLIINLGKKSTLKESINELSKILTTLHSAASYLALDPVASLALLGKNLVLELAEAPSLDLVASSQMIDWLLDVADQLALYYKNIENNDLYFNALNPKIIKIPIDIFS